ncbi:MAG: ABC-2 family transporter protein [Candidatus Abawacabacteria bacterium]|nr:ABC-2 family transporter protein [Candidatus Abawacabacteria bacterium]
MSKTILIHIAVLKLLCQRSIKILRMEKRNFYLFLLAFIAGTVLNIFVLHTAFRNIPYIQGWNFYNVLALLATYRLCKGIFSTFIGSNLEKLTNIIRKGKLDLFLIKPASGWFLMYFSEVDLARITDLITGLFLLIYTLFFIQWQWWTLILYFFAFIIGLILMTCTYLIISMTAFLDMREAGVDFIDKLIRSTSRFPLRFASDTIQFLLTWILPFMYLSTIPVEVLENRTNIIATFSSALAICAIYIFLTSYLWKKGLQHYSSASS